MPPKGTVDKSDTSNDGKYEDGGAIRGNDDEEEDRFEHSDEEEKESQRSQHAPIKDGNDSPPTSIGTATSVFPSFVHTGLQRKASFTGLKYWIALSLTLDGRDKITKVLQYSSRFLAWWFLSKVRTSGTYHGHGRRFTNLYKSLGKSRKAFRLGRSINEIQKISNVGLLGLFFWHLKHQYLEDNYERKGNEEVAEECRSGNKIEPEEPPSSGVSSISFSPSTRLAAVPYLEDISQRMFSVLSSSLGAVFPSNDESRIQWWKVIGSSLKTICMFGYWLGDNANFLTSSGALDNYKLSEKDRLALRKRWQDFTGKRANQFYFFAATIGLATNAFAYYRLHQKNALRADEQDQIENGDASRCNAAELRKEEEKQFVLFLALLKSCMDVVVFSNNPGIDLHKKLRGRKNHEAIHCVCGLISAGASLYNSFPDSKI